MEDKFQLYTIFTKFVTLLGTLNGLSVSAIQKIIKENYSTHPYAASILPKVKGLEVNEDIKFLFNECIRICDELGPSREYFTIRTLLRNITHDIIALDKAEAKELSQEILEKFEQEIALINQKIPKPPLFNIMLESRSLVEWSSIYCIYPFIPKRIKGKGRPVLLIPPYLGDDYSTSFVRRYLTSLGFKTYKWEQGFNMIKSHYIPRLEEKLFDIFQEHGEKVSLVGWSGGGIFAKIMANRHPDQVEQIVTIGSPVWGVWK
ncbi:MAG: alpha/beta hydrolase [Bacteroidota bacterium]